MCLPLWYKRSLQSALLTCSCCGRHKNFKLRICHCNQNSRVDRSGKVQKSSEPSMKVCSYNGEQCCAMSESPTNRRLDLLVSSRQQFCIIRHILTCCMYIANCYTGQLFGDILLKSSSKSLKHGKSNAAALNEFRRVTCGVLINRFWAILVLN